ncbi:N-acetylglucosamine kinase [Psychroserpens jangbogonensis]|uniref:N-acetylglucosamine kinase n=1 Tax=Psychroserpens jangbogonensis TaxID=1484460 RepID=UPI00053E1085|nr:N-acetylglucosamine kinase [Psychroserpens jangbogonensis]
MILITDSGSTKCDWIVIDELGEQLQDKIRTKGLNPAILSEKKLNKIIRKSDDLMQFKDNVTHIFFYGAGCGTTKPRLMLAHILETIFSNAIIDVQEDTMAAVRATQSHSNEAAVVCIMGTGSNCSYFDGTRLYQRVVSLGYTIMDEASGNYYGKELLKDYYFNHMPGKIKVAFDHKYNVEADFIKHNLYKEPNPNAYLANFAEFMFLNKDSEYIRELIKKGLRLFAKNMIFQYKEELKTVPVHFAGSIAFFAEDEIRQVANELGFTVGNFERRPIEGLVIYHTKELKL